MPLVEALLRGEVVEVLGEVVSLGDAGKDCAAGRRAKREGSERRMSEARWRDRREEATWMPCISAGALAEGAPLNCEQACVSFRAE